jgi:hypothetical protein
VGRFLKGYLSYFSESFGLLPEFKQEQVIYRTEKAKECVTNKSCLYCGCDTPAKFYSDEGCEDPVRKCYPDMMDKDTWEQFKKDNDYFIDLSNERNKNGSRSSGPR